MHGHSGHTDSVVETGATRSADEAGSGIASRLQDASGVLLAEFRWQEADAARVRYREKVVVAHVRWARHRGHTLAFDQTVA